MVKKIQKLVSLTLYTTLALIASFTFLYQAGSLPKYIFGDDFYMISLWLSFAVVILFVIPATGFFTYGFSKLYATLTRKTKSSWLNACWC